MRRHVNLLEPKYLSKISEAFVTVFRELHAIDGKLDPILAPIFDHILFDDNLFSKEERGIIRDGIVLGLLHSNRPNIYYINCRGITLIFEVDDDQIYADVARLGNDPFHSKKQAKALKLLFDCGFARKDLS